MDIQTQEPVKVVSVSGISVYAIVFGIFAIIAAILAFIIPIFGTLFITPAAIFFGIIALWGGARSFGIATFIILVVKLAISPIFWANIFIGAIEVSAGGNRIFSYVIIIGMLVMLFLLFKKGRFKN